MKDTNYNRQDLWDVKYDIVDYASQQYDNALSDLSFDRDYALLLDLVKDPETSLPEDFKISKEELVEFLTLMRNGIDKWLKEHK